MRLLCRRAHSLCFFKQKLEHYSFSTEKRAFHSLPEDAFIGDTGFVCMGEVETLNRKRWNHNPLFLERFAFYTLLRRILETDCQRQTCLSTSCSPLAKNKMKQTNKKNPKNTQTKGHRTSSTKQDFECCHSQAHFGFDADLGLRQ